MARELLNNTLRKVLPFEPVSYTHLDVYKRQGLLYAMMNISIYPMIVTYKLKLSQIIKNAFILTMVKLPRTILIFALVAVILFLCLSYLVGVVVPVSYTHLPWCCFHQYLL